MQLKLRQVVGHQEKGLFAAVGTFPFRQGNFFFNVPPGLIQSLGQHGNVFVGSFEIVKRRFGLIAHYHAFPGWPDTAATSANSQAPIILA